MTDNALVAVRNPDRMDPLRWVLERTDTRRMDIVILAVEIEEVLSNEVTRLFS